MNLDLQDIAVIVLLTSTITTAAMIPLLYKFKDSLKTDFCKEIQAIKVRLGIVEREHDQENIGHS